MTKYYKWRCSVCGKEFTATAHWWKGCAGFPYGRWIEYNDNPQDEKIHPPRNICHNCAKDALVWAGKQARKEK